MLAPDVPCGAPEPFAALSGSVLMLCVSLTALRRDFDHRDGWACLGRVASDRKPIVGLPPVTVAGGYPLATEDAIFDDVVTLRRKFPDA